MHSLRVRLPQLHLQTRITQLPSCRLLRNFQKRSCCSITSPECLKGSVSGVLQANTRWSKKPKLKFYFKMNFETNMLNPSNSQEVIF